VVQPRVSMRKLREVLRLKFERGLSYRQIARSVGLAHSTVSEYVSRAERAGLAWPLAPELGDAALEARLYPGPPPRGTERPLPDWEAVRRELASHKGVTLQLLWLEYREAHPEGYGYSQFCDLYRRWREGLDVVLRQSYRAGEKCFVDYAGPTVEIVDSDTGEVREAVVFVGVLGASNYTFVDLTWSRSLPDWIGSHVRMLAFFGGVPEVIVPDNEKSGVGRASRYEPDLNPTYRELAVHYGITVIPARPHAPRDKAKVEAAVLAVERRVLAPLRHHTFFSLAEARSGLAPRLAALNDRPFQKIEGSRRSLFEALDRPALGPLPAAPYAYAEWRQARVSIDYHIQVRKHFYSVPYQLARQQVEVRMTATMVEVFCRGRRVALHVRSHRPGGYTTDPAHMPAAHRAHLEWSPSRLIAWGGEVGPETARFVERLLASRPHPEQGYRSCLGLMKLARSYPADRVEAACRRALEIGSLSYRSVQSILRSGVDRLPLEPELPLRLPGQHAHLRGPDYYRTPPQLRGD